MPDVTFDQCEALARAIGCHIWDGEDANEFGTGMQLRFIVFPPHGIYGGEAEFPNRRRSPESIRQGTIRDLGRLWEVLKVLQDDLHFHRYGVGSILTRDALTRIESDPTARQLLDDWIATKNPNLGLVLADRLEDERGGGVAGYLRKCLEWHVEQARKIVKGRIPMNTDTSSTGSSFSFDDGW